MNKIDYLLLAFKHGSYMYKEWIIECFGIVHLPELPNNPDFHKSTGKDQTSFAISSLPEDKRPIHYSFERYPLQLFQHDDKVCFFHPDNQECLELEDVTIGEPFFSFKEEVSLKKGQMVNLDRDVVTWIGNMITNQILLVYPFGDLIPFQTGTYRPKDIEKKIEPLLVPITYAQKNDPNFKRDPSKIYTDVLDELYYQAGFSFDGWCRLAAPAGTVYGMLTDPRVKKRKEELLKEHWDAVQAGDVVVITNITKELIALDREYQGKDPEGGFLESDAKKLFDVVRAKQYLMYGLEWDFNDSTKAKLITRPLEEQWDITQLHMMANSIVSGSHNRGSQTALGGEIAKILTRFFLNTAITEDDCKVKYGYKVRLLEDNLYGYDEVYYRVGQKWELADKEKLKPFINKIIEFRSPMYCQTKDGFCLHCIGLKYENLKSSLGSLSNEVGNIIMYIFMKRMHGISLATVEWDIDTEIF